MSSTLIASCLYWLHPPLALVAHLCRPNLLPSRMEPVNSLRDKADRLLLNVRRFYIIWGNGKHSPVTNCCCTTGTINLYQRLWDSVCSTPAFGTGKNKLTHLNKGQRIKRDQEAAAQSYHNHTTSTSHKDNLDSTDNCLVIQCSYKCFVNKNLSP